MKRPNILLITSDQQHWNTIGKVNPKIQTPALDRLCDEGTRFDRAYCNNPTSTPSRASIITGMHPSEHGAWSLGTILNENIPTIGDMLRNVGYATHLIGKAHFQPLHGTEEYPSIETAEKVRDLEYWRNFKGPWYGFQGVELARNHADEAWAGQHYAIWMEEKGFKDWREYFHPTPGDHPGKHIVPQPAGRYWEREHGRWELPEEYHYSVWTADRTIANIEQAIRDDKPFMTWASFHDPHPPYVVPKPWCDMYNPDDMEPGRYQEGEFEDMPPYFKLTREPNPDFSPWQETPHANHGFETHLQDYRKMQEDMAIYYGMMSLMDREIGRILDALDRLGVAENTIVVFSTDHGHFLGQHGLVAKGAFHYEDLIRVPFIVRYPNHVPGGRVSNALQGLVDLTPTFLDACGMTVPGSMSGVSQLPVWEDRADAARSMVICENHHQPTALQLRTYVGDRYKLTIHRDSEYGELFDLVNDPDEHHNRFNDPEYASVKSELMWQALQEEQRREPMAMPRIWGA